jgi:hypothetical protein
LCSCVTICAQERKSIEMLSDPLKPDNAQVLIAGTGHAQEAGSTPNITHEFLSTRPDISHENEAPTLSTQSAASVDASSIASEQAREDSNGPVLASARPVDGRGIDQQEQQRNEQDESQEANKNEPSSAVSTEAEGPKITSENKDYRKAFPEWPYEGKNLKHSGKSFYITVIADTLLLFIPLCFVSIAIMGEVLDGRSVALNAWGLHLITLKGYGVTAYEILFAVICGRGIKNIATWWFTKGARIQFLEQMLGSRSIASTLTTQYKLKAYGPVAATLIVIWALSPVGAQAILRLLDTAIRSNSSQGSVYYINSNSSGRASGFQSLVGDLTDSYSYVYQASLIAPNSTHNGPRDLWGNTKIPNIEKLDQSSATDDGWIKVPDLASYSSLVGVSMANLSQHGNSTFVLPSSYYTLNCPKGPQILPWTEEILWTESGAKYRGNGQSLVGYGTQRLGSPYTNYSSPYLTNISSPDSNLAPEFNFWSIGTFTSPQYPYYRTPIDPISVYLQFATINKTDNSDEITALNCRLTYSNVDSQVLCNGKDCQVVAMRSRNSIANDSYPSPLDSSDVAYKFFSGFVRTTGTNNLITQFNENSFMMQYLQYGFNPIGTPDYSNDINLTAISGDVLAERLSRLMNSYWQPSLSLEFVTGNFPSNLSTVEGIEPAIAAIETAEEIFVCPAVWFAFLLTSSSVLFTISIIGYILHYFFTVAPDLTGHVSSLTRDNLYVNIPKGGSSLSGFKRAIYLKDVMIKIGDAKPDDEMGHIVVMSVDAAREKAGKLDRDRKYK